MKKIFISVLLVLTILMPVLPGQYAEAANVFVQYPFSATTIMRAGATRGVEDVNFDYGFTSIDVYLSGCATGHDIKGDIRIDGISGKIIGSFDYSSSIVPYYWAPINFRVQITEIVTGVHDVYLINKSGEYNPLRIQCNYFEGSKTIYKSYKDEQTFNDIEDSEDVARVEFLTQLGFFDAEEESFNSNLPVSRADVIQTLALFWDESEYPEVPVDVFKDVENEATREAAYFLYTKDILKLEDTAYLEPSEYIKASELAQYGANMFPHDDNVFRKIADAVSSDDGYVRRTQLVDMLYTVVTAKYKILGGNPFGEMYYEEYDEGILGKTKKWYLAEGLVTANSYTGLYSSEDKTKDYTVRIGDYVYNIGDTNADTYIGVFCRFIWYDDNNEIILKGIIPKYPSNINIYSNEYDYESFTGDGIIYMNETGKKREIEFSSDTKIIYNSRALDVEVESIIPDASKFRGKITAIDNNRDDVIDVCIINDAKSMIIKSIASDYIVDELTGEKVVFGEDDNIEFIRNGIKTGAENYKVGESIDLYISASGENKFCQILLGSEITGNISKISEDEITFDSGKVYKLSPYAVYAPKAGDAGTFKLNTFGEVIHYVKSDGTLLNVGWMIKAVGNLDEEYAGMTIKNTDNEIIHYTFADGVRADGVYVKELKDLIKGKSPFVGLESLEEQMPVLYRLNDNNELQIIDTVADGNSDRNYDQLNKNLEPMSSGTYFIQNSVIYTYGSRTGGASYDDGGLAYIDSGVMCYVKSALDESLSLFEKKVSIGAKRNFTGYSFKKGSPKVDLMLVSGGATGDTWFNPLVYVGKSKVSVNDDAELVTTLKFEDYDSTVEYNVSNILYETDATYRAKIDGLQKGDIICGKTESSTNELMTLNIAHFMGNEYDGFGDTRPIGSSGTYSSLLNSSTDSKAYEWEKRMLLGNVVEVDPEYIKIQRAVDTQYTEVTIPNRVTVISINEDGEVTERGSSIAAVHEGQRVICFFAKGELSYVYLYDNLND